MLSPQSGIDDCKPAHFLQTAYQFVKNKFIAFKLHNRLFVSFPKRKLCERCQTAVQSVAKFCVLPWIYRLCSRIFFSWMKLGRKIALCSSELSLDTSWNFMRTFHGHKERNLRILLALLLYNTVGYCLHERSRTCHLHVWLDMDFSFKLFATGYDLVLPYLFAYKPRP